LKIQKQTHREIRRTVGVTYRIIKVFMASRDRKLGQRAAMDANPIGLAVIGVAALAVAAYEIYEHCV
jgi:hypothetical protein